ncbi:hypothetical protein RHD99_12615 [Buttiauxella selenatireducens]|uniref:Uncharacterized protein n=1 Tax=Buttiauxella selenatireducens TaxID=3073902 RepID=A0ABY9S5M7_9ENTR|nr:hypothetical protein [Buttiauxella sp. R73]WMY72335.1 hypothetical protein RHD99_12615 [Buttiauxella sp. R73]
MAKIIKALLAFKPLIKNSVVRFIIGFPITLGALQLSEHYQDINNTLMSKIFLTLAVILAYYLIVLSVIDGMTGRIYSFHETKNAANLHKNPLKFAFRHRNKIVLFYKVGFIIALGYPLIMLWFFD